MTQRTTTAIPADLSASLQRGATRAAVVGVVLVGVSVAGAFGHVDQIFRSLLIGFVFWCGVALGSLALLMLQHAAHGRWGLVARRVLEASAGTFPFLALGAVAIVIGMPHLFEWSHRDFMLADPVLKQKLWYLNTPFFVGRLVGYFAIWLGLSALLRRWSSAQDAAKDQAVARALSDKMRKLSGPGLVVWVVSTTFLSFDLIMSLEPHWYSTMFGVIYMIGCGLSAFAFTIAVLVVLSRRAPLAGLVTTDNLHDLGKLLFAFVLLWAYVSVSQWIIVWQGNLPEEVPWYLERLAGMWKWVTVAVIFGHFALPFALLLSRQTKRNPRLLVGIAVFLLLMRYVEQAWLVVPAFGEHEADVFHPAPFPWTHATLPMGFGALWIAVVLWRLRGRSLLPDNDPQLQPGATT